MSRTPLPNEPPLLDPERAIRLAEEASAFVHAPKDEYHPLGRLAVQTAIGAAHVALETAIDTGDPRVLAAALDLASARLRWRDEHVEYELASAASPIFPAVTEIGNRVRECARSRSSILRATTATGLGPRAQRSLAGEGDEVDAEAAGIVVALTKDADADVRAAAREALGGAAPPAWATFFRRDPLAARAAAEAARLRGPLDRAAEALEKGVRRDSAPLADAIAELPDELAAPILEAWIRTPYATHAKSAESLLDRWFVLDPDGERTVAWLRTVKDDDFDFKAGAHVGAALRRRPSEQARAIALRVVELLPELEDNLGALEVAEAILGEAWPDDADPAPLLEAALGAPLAGAGSVINDEDDVPDVSKLIEVALAERPSFATLIEPLVDAFVAGLPGRWARAKYPIEQRLVKVRHPRLRAHAEMLLRSAEGQPLAWALRHLTGGGHDPALDPPVSTYLRSAARDPRLRAVMITNETLREPAQAVLRALLAAGELPPAEAIALARSLFRSDDEGSLRPAEWDAVRRAREGVEDPAERASATLLLPSHDRWTPEDHAFVDALIRDHAGDDGVAMWIALSFSPSGRRRVRPELVPLLERVLERASPVAIPMVRRALCACRGEEES